MRGVIPSKRLAEGRRRRRRGRPPRLDRERYIVEHTVGGLTRFRRPATRDEKLTVKFMAFGQFASGVTVLQLLSSDRT